VLEAVALLELLADSTGDADELDAGQCRISRYTLAPIARPESFAGT
jgi:hypothetical protein